MDWQKVLFDSDRQVIQALDRVAIKYFPTDQDLAHQTVTDVISKITENDFERLNKQGEISYPHAYLITVATNLIKDAAVSRFGRCRPPEWLKKLGQLWVTTHKYLCCYSLDANEICFRLSSPEFDLADIKNICTEIKVRHAKCGKEVEKPTRVSVDDAFYDDLPDTTNKTPEKVLSNQELELFFSVLSKICLGQDVKNTQEISEALAEIRNKLVLEPKEILVLKLVYQERKSLSEAARLLGDARHNVEYRLKNTLKKIRIVFQEHGFNFEA
ncbi:MAG: hypothetical protein GJ680_07270 [Alteromonadaceae bacterium]|nr:hypothetical protein [Alteromonadaceae bacterium]